MPIPSKTLLLVGLLVVVGVWLASPSPAAAQPAPTSPPTTTTTTRPGGGPPPTVAPAPAGPPPPAPGPFDVAGRIREAVNGWLRDLVARAIDPAVDLAARSVLATPELAAPGGRVRELWALSVGWPTPAMCCWSPPVGCC